MYVADVHLSLGGTRIANNSYVDIDSIGTSGSDTDALLCHTDNYTDGDWYYDNNNTIVRNASIANNTRAFVSDKNLTVVKLFRTNTSESIIGGQFYCMVNETSVYYINIGKLSEILWKITLLLLDMLVDCLLFGICMFPYEILIREHTYAKLRGITVYQHINHDKYITAKAIPCGFVYLQGLF